MAFVFLLPPLLLSSHLEASPSPYPTAAVIDQGTGSGVFYQFSQYADTANCTGPPVNPDASTIFTNSPTSPSATCFPSGTGSVSGIWCDMSTTPPRYKGNVYLTSGTCTGEAIAFDNPADGLTCSPGGFIFMCSYGAPAGMGDGGPMPSPGPVGYYGMVPPPPPPGSCEECACYTFENGLKPAVPTTQRIQT